MPTAKRGKPSDEELEATLRQLEEAVLANRIEQSDTLMEQLWRTRQRTAEVLTEQLVSGRARVPFVSFHVLPMFAGNRTGKYLRRVAEAESAQDIVRFGARRRMGWPETRETRGRLTFLASLRDGAGTLVEALHQAASMFPYPPDIEVMREVLGYLLVMPASEAIEVVEVASTEMGRQISWVLRALLQAKDGSVRRAALKELLAVGDTGARGAIDLSMLLNHDAGFDQEADAAKRRFQVEVVGTGKQSTEETLPPIHSAYLSSIDGDGGQVAIVVRERAEDVYLVVQMFFKDHWGIKDAFGMNAITWSEITSLYGSTDNHRLKSLGLGQMLLDEVDEPAAALEPAIPLIEVDLAAVRGAIDSALRVSLAARRRLPPGFGLLEPLLHTQDPAQSDEEVVSPELDDAGYMERDDLYHRSGALLDLPTFQAWFFNPEEIVPLLTLVPRPKERRLTEKQFHPLIDTLVDARVSELIRRRLRRQAWLLDRTGDSVSRDTALAAAARLTGGSTPLSRHPLLRGMVLNSLSNALRVQYVES